MAKIGRNDPCPCGSGRKHKHCCRRNELEAESRRQERLAAPARALDWLMETYRAEVHAAFDQLYFGLLDEEEEAHLGELPAGLKEMIQINSGEWLVAQAWLTLRDGKMARASELILGPGGPLFTVEERAYLEELAARPLGLYEVRDSKPGEGILLKNMLDKSQPQLWVEERLGSERLVRWDVVGARLIFVDGRCQLSGCVYHFDPEAGVEVRKSILKLLSDSSPQAKWDSEIANLVFVAGTIIGFWLSLLAAPRQTPKLVDAGTGDPLMLVTDHYEVLDWDRLAEALESQADVEGDRKDGWTRFVDVDVETRRSLLAINIGKKSGRIEPFARTLRLADEGRSWLERIAGDALRFLIREITDPGSSRALEDRARRRAPEAIRLPHGETQRIYERLYKDWADKPIPALGDVSPRKAVRSRTGQAKVVELLKQYEASELRRARRDGEDPVDFGFLWREIGLDRDAALIS